MVLSGRAIRSGIEEGIIGITPLEDDQIDRAHVDIHLGEIEGADGGAHILGPKAFVLARTLEVITLPPNVCGLIEGRASWAKRGISIEQPSTFIEGLLMRSKIVLLVAVLPRTSHETTSFSR